MIERDSNNRPSKPPDFLEVDKDSDNQLLSEKYKKEYSSSLVLNYFSVSYKVLMYLGIVVLASWLSYQQGKVDGRSEQNSATITSDNETTTIIPDDPGGLEIPNQNLTIYDSGEDLTESSTLNPEENQTMPEPDQPIMSVDPEPDFSQSEINNQNIEENDNIISRDEIKSTLSDLFSFFNFGSSNNTSKEIDEENE